MKINSTDIMVGCMGENSTDIMEGCMGYLI